MKSPPKSGKFLIYYTYFIWFYLIFYWTILFWPPRTHYVSVLWIFASAELVMLVSYKFWSLLNQIYGSVPADAAASTPGVTGKLAIYSHQTTSLILEAAIRRQRDPASVWSYRNCSKQAFLQGYYIFLTIAIYVAISMFNRAFRDILIRRREGKVSILLTYQYGINNIFNKLELSFRNFNS